MKWYRVSLVAALAAGVLATLVPVARAEDQPAQRPERRQGGPGPGERGDMLKKIAEELKLTDEQKTQLQAAMKEQREALQGLKDAPPEERRAAMKEARDNMDAKVKEILTPEQYAKWLKLREQHRPGGPGGPGGKPPGPKPTE